MESRFSINSKNAEKASASSSTGVSSTSAFGQTLSIIEPASSHSSAISHQGSLLEKEGYRTSDAIDNTNDVTVITARSSETGGVVTIKIMTKVGNSGFCRKKGFYQEIEMMRQLNHPNLIKYYRSIETPNRYYIVMECAQNGSLSDLIREKGCLTEPGARSIYRQLASVLSYCNSRGCIHHDIKSGNILFDANSVLKISIFGYSYRNMINHCVVVDTDCESSSLTEPDYADIFGSGIVLFEMVFGKLPKGYDIVSLKHSLRRVHFPDEPAVDSECKSLISRILVPQHGNRISWNDIADTDWMLRQDIRKVEN
ncbi:testis-specific serine/threonine-protein kinase 4-like [Bradysia coprophila]|uniref:testis-specific serine/threonine-protein kinase 4-like n=1 Tax=Bradysia coprophila TaxID=38358 RepID=UPI00187DBF02|nr:testis-specific serine/threonine-protein kinase 4-like [Bradysia coprophila]